MNKTFIASAIALSLTMSPVAFSSAKDAKSVESDEISTISQLSTAQDLARLGMENKDALILITAAQLMKSVSMSELTEERAQKTALEDNASEGNKEGEAITPEMLLALAETYAGSDEALEALIMDTKQMPQSRGRVGGAANQISRVLAQDTDQWTITYRGGEVAELLVSGDDDTDLDFYLYDDNGNLIFSDEDRTDDFYYRWTPRWTGPFKLRIRNLGNVYNQYVIATN